MAHYINYTVIPYAAVTTDPRGKSKLHKLCEGSDLKALSQCIESRFYLNPKDNTKLAPLHNMVAANKVPILTGLLEAGANPDIPNGFYKTPLHLAVEDKNMEIIQVLMKYGANPYLKDSNGYTCFDKSTLEIRKFLEDYKFQSFPIFPTIFIKSEIKVHLFNISEAGKEKYKSLIKVSWYHFIQYDDATHLVVGLDDGLSLPYLVALLKGIYVVEETWQPEWMRDGNWLPSTIEAIPEEPKQIIFRSAQNAFLNRPPLFDGMKFYIVEDSTIHFLYGLTLSKFDLILLIETGGGLILRRFPSYRDLCGNDPVYPYHLNLGNRKSQCSHIVIFNEGFSIPEYAEKLTTVLCKSSRWLINCILNFEVNIEENE